MAGAHCWRRGQCCPSHQPAWLLPAPARGSRTAACLAALVEKAVPSPLHCWHTSRPRGQRQNLQKHSCLEEVWWGVRRSLAVCAARLWVLTLWVNGNLPTSYFWRLWTHLDSLVVAYWGGLLRIVCTIVLKHNLLRSQLLMTRSRHWVIPVSHFLFQTSWSCWKPAEGNLHNLFKWLAKPNTRDKTLGNQWS